MSKKNRSYTLCTTYESAASAAEELSRSSAVILDCEGHNFGKPGGALSLIAIGKPNASHTFVFDVVSLSNAHHPLLAPLLSLLVSEDITKVVWDGRCDFMEIAEAYGVAMRGVLDLQLVEVAERRNTGTQKNKRFRAWRAKHTAEYFKKLQKEITKDPSILDGVYRVYGLDHCAGIFGVLKGLEGKDARVVSLHKENGSAMWMDRPLPDLLLEYSVHDIEIISRLYARFNSNNLKSAFLPDLNALKAMSMRYMHVYTSREARERLGGLGLSPFVPQEVLEAPQAHAARHECARCARALPLQSFTTDAQPGEGRAKKRQTFCNLCALLARKGKEVSLSEWVVVGA